MNRNHLLALALGLLVAGFLPACPTVRVSLARRCHQAQRSMLGVLDMWNIDHNSNATLTPELIQKFVDEGYLQELPVCFTRHEGAAFRLRFLPESNQIYCLRHGFFDREAPRSRSAREQLTLLGVKDPQILLEASDLPAYEPLPRDMLRQFAGLPGVFAGLAGFPGLYLLALLAP